MNTPLRGPGLDLCRFPMFTLRVSRLIPDYTMERIYHVLAWSFRASWHETTKADNFLENPLDIRYIWSIMFVYTHEYTKHNIYTHIYIYVYVGPCYFYSTHITALRQWHMGFIQKLILKVTRYQQCMPNGMANPLQAIAFRKCWFSTKVSFVSGFCSQSQFPIPNASAIANCLARCCLRWLCCSGRTPRRLEVVTGGLWPNNTLG